MFSSNTSQVSGDAVYIEDVFSTYLYTGTGVDQTITNGIDLAGKGGLVWVKSRSAVKNNCLVDTVRGVSKALASNTTGAQDNSPGYYVNAFNANGFGVGAVGDVNGSGVTFGTWTFRKQPKFFDVVTYTGNGTSGRQIAHNLGSTPGCIIVKSTSAATVWAVYHRSLGGTNYLRLNTTDASVSNSTFWNNTDPTSTVFTVGNAQGTNQSATDYVAYIFAHDAGGFGLTGTDNVISCGNFSFSAGKATISLGYEPQYLLLKKTNGAEQWWLFDTMRGMTASLTGNNYLTPNSSVAEADLGSITQPTATGFYLDWSNQGITTGDYIYIAIRRGPMKVPTDATKVFAPVVSSAADGTQITAGFSVDMQMYRYRAGTVNTYVVDRLRGVGTTTTAIATPQVRTNLTTAEANTIGVAVNWNNTGFAMPTGFGGVSDVFWNFARAPSFFDEVCYTYTSGSFVANHNLGVTPEMVILKRRDSTGNWFVYHQALGFSQRLNLNTTDSVIAASAITAATSTTFTTGFPGVGGATVVAYLFASCTGVSKVGSYAGNGSSQTINCGFTGGVRFLMIKNTTLGGTDWQVWDTARGITAGNDPVLYLNSTSPEVNADFITNNSVGFTLNNGDSQYNASGSTYIYLAIA